VQQLTWVAIAWVAGTAAILGSLMTLGSLLLWMVPSQPRSKKPDEQASSIPASPWQNRLKLLTFSIAIALAGISLLIAVSFPQS
jgi:hypothetical protein